MKKILILISVVLILVTAIMITKTKSNKKEDANMSYTQITMDEAQKICILS